MFTFSRIQNIWEVLPEMSFPHTLHVQIEYQSLNRNYQLLFKQKKKEEAIFIMDLQPSYCD